MAKPGPKKGEGGRPTKDIDLDQLAALCRMKPTQKDCADFFKVSVDTIARKIKDASGLTFAEFRDQNMVHTRFSLIRKAIKKAENGDNTMLIFCLKNMCGWRDKPPEDEEGDKDTWNLSSDQIKALVSAVKKEAG